jgi:hypothetical protein
VNDIELRDQIARDCSNPSLQDIKELLKLPSDTPLMPEKPTTGEGMEIKPAVKSVQEIFQELPLRTRCRVIWKYKYTYAQAAMHIAQGGEL